MCRRVPTRVTDPEGFSTPTPIESREMARPSRSCQSLTTRRKRHRIARVAPVKDKVWIYVLRRRAEIELLVFEHVDVGAGIQIPAGTVEPEEDFARAARRELLEESGVSVTTLAALGGHVGRWDGVEVHAHWYAARAPNELPDAWTHHVTGGGGDKDMRFRFFWLPQNSWHKLFGDFKLAYPTLECWLTREFPMGTK